MYRIALLGVAIIIGGCVQSSKAGSDTSHSHEHAHDHSASHVQMSIKGDQRCIRSQATPAHSVGQFPTRGNPHSFRPQDLTVCVDATPEKTGQVTRSTSASGITLSGILLRPGTAEYYDPNGRRGFSRDRSSGWRVEGMGAASQLGMDHANAHVDHRGLYHYHAPADIWTADLIGGDSASLIGYAADGFEIHYIGDQARSSWQLKSGTRPAGANSPGGRYDGTYEQDYAYRAGSGTLDECNGATVEGRYVYFATDTYPFFPRCFKGTVSRDLQRRR